MPPLESGVIDPVAGSMSAGSAPAASTPYTIPAPISARAALHRNINLTRELALTQFKLKYTGSVLGYLWSLLKPAMLFGIMYVIFVYFFHADRSSKNFPIQLLLGIVLWNFFGEATGAAISSIAGSGGLIRKAYFPRAILVIASTLTALLTFVINFCIVLLVGAGVGGLSLGLRSLAAVPLFIELYALILGVSLLLSSLFVFYRDIGHIWEVTSQTLFYGSAVVYPFSLVPGRFLPKIFACNPVAQIIEDSRHALVTTDPRVPWITHVLTHGLYAIPLLLSLGILACGLYVFRRLTPRFAENL